MTIHLISGFLGSGKTTAIQQAVRFLVEEGILAGVITNDQGSKLVDAGLFNGLGVPSREVINGCFCCNYHDLESGIESLLNVHNVEMVFAESVGTCTDIVATVLKPLTQKRPEATITFSVFADGRLLQMILEDRGSFDETVRYIYKKQLEEAGIIVVTKVDLITPGQLQQIKNRLQVCHPSKTLIFQNSFVKDDIQRWLMLLNTHAIPALNSLEIDYDQYAAGEAKMAWLDQLIEIFSTTADAMKVAENIINKIIQKIKAEGLPVGHLKFLLDDTIKISFTSCDESPVVLPTQKINTISLLVNMRVETAPARLMQIVNDVIEETKHTAQCTIIVNSQSAFQPGYPTPAFRL